MSAYLIATGVSLIPIGLCLLLILSAVEKGRRGWALAHPVRAVREMMADPPEEDDEPA